MFKPTLCILSAILISAGCDRREAETRKPISERPIRIVATTGMVADLVKNVGGDRVAVTNLMGPGIDPHQYKASERDVSRLAEADLIFYNGLHLEGAMGRVFEKMKEMIPTVAVGGAINPDLLLHPAVFEGSPDPHIWFDVTLWMQACQSIREALEKLDSSHAVFYRDNAARYLSELERLHRYVQDQAALLPPGQRVLITAHDAFNYFGRAYGFEVRGLQGINTAGEAGTADVQALARFIAERKIPALFVESSVPRRTIEAVQAAVRAKGFEVTIGGELFSDALGNPDTPEGTYAGMIRHNIDAIVKALSPGSSPGR